MPLLIAIYALLFAYLAHKNFRLAVGIFIISLPAYLIRFRLGPLPSTLLELNFAILALVWLIKYSRADWLNLRSFFSQNKFFTAALAVFFIASIAGVFVSDMWYYSFGQWRAYFLEPIIFFLILLGRNEYLKKESVILALVAGTIPVSLIAIGQKFFPALYPPSLWNDELFGRATSFFTTPNAIGLLIVPALLAGASLIKGRWKNIYFFALGTGLIALGLSRSLGALAGLCAGALVIIYFLYSKKIILIIIAAMLLFALSPLSQFTTKNTFVSMRNRITLWRHTANFLSASPKNFILGAGIRQYFRKVEKPHYNPKELERLIYPHNIFLNFWTEIGLLGPLSFGALLYCLALSAYRLLLNDRVCAAALLAALLSFAVHGIIDVPYFKNDLAMMFWILAAVVMASRHEVLSSKY